MNENIYQQYLSSSITISFKILEIKNIYGVSSGTNINVSCRVIKTAQSEYMFQRHRFRLPLL